MKRIFTLLIIVGFIYIFYNLNDFKETKELSRTAKYYANNAVKETKSANLVTSVVVTYRGLDTLGEVTILFITTTIIGLIMKMSSTKRSVKELRPSSELFETASKILFPIIFIFGVYIFINGHLSPGGGFQGGAVIASAVLLVLMAQPAKEFSHKIISTVESVAGIVYVIIGIVGLYIGLGFLDNRIMELGSVGKLFSAGAIPIIYILVGLKVGAELTNILIYLQDVNKEEKCNK